MQEPTAQLTPQSAEGTLLCCQSNTLAGVGHLGMPVDLGPGAPLSLSSLAPPGGVGGASCRLPSGTEGLEAEGRKPSINTGWGNEQTNGGSQGVAGSRSLSRVSGRLALCMIFLDFTLSSFLGISQQCHYTNEIWRCAWCLAHGRYLGNYRYLFLES